MKYILTTFLVCLTFQLSSQEDIIGSYSNHKFKVDDYIYMANDTIVISSTEAYQLEKCNIEISETSFIIDDGGMGFKSKKVISNSTGLEDKMIHSIIGPYGDQWNVLKANINEESIIAIFHARQKMQPVLNYSIYSTFKISEEELHNVLLSYLEIERKSIHEYHLIGVDKYEIGEIQEIKSFVKRSMIIK